LGIYRNFISCETGEDRARIGDFSGQFSVDCSSRTRTGIRPEVGEGRRGPPVRRGKKRETQGLASAVALRA
jgi:hypothetical protein